MVAVPFFLLSLLPTAKAAATATATVKERKPDHRGRTVRCARAVRALCEKLPVLHHREFGEFRRLKGRH